MTNNEYQNVLNLVGKAIDAADTRANQCKHNPSNIDPAVKDVVCHLGALIGDVIASGDEEKIAMAIAISMLLAENSKVIYRIGYDEGYKAAILKFQQENN
jgi:hypothetical protein